MFKSAEFLKAVTDPRHAPEARPSVVFAGRSNVGKSSLINRLVGRKGLARTSSTPGRTREIHFYDIEDRWFFIDLPGYGYAKVSKTLRRTWGPMVERFMRQARGIRLVVMILDIRRDPTPEDLQLIDRLDQGGHPYIFAVTKCDKLKKQQQRPRLAALQSALELPDDSALVPVSGRTGMGIEDFAEVVRGTLEDSVEQAPAV